MKDFFRITFVVSKHGKGIIKEFKVTSTTEELFEYLINFVKFYEKNNFKVITGFVEISRNGQWEVL